MCPIHVSIFVYMCLIMCIYPLIINMSHLIYKLNLHNLVLSPCNDNNTYKLITASGSQGNIYLYISPLCQIM